LINDITQLGKVWCVLPEYFDKPAKIPAFEREKFIITPPQWAGQEAPSFDGVQWWMPREWAAMRWSLITAGCGDNTWMRSLVSVETGHNI